MRLSGKVAVVTGAGRGIGKGIAVRMSQEGASIVVNDVNTEDMQKTVSEIKSAGGTAIGFKADVSKRSEVRDLMKATVDKLGKIDILVNNAGVTRHKPFMEMGDADWDTVLAVDLKGVFNCSQAAATYMIPRRYGKIINISSGAALGVSAHMGGNFNYAAAKAGVVQLTKSMARELGPHGINVNSIAPGHVPTLLSSNTRSDQDRIIHTEQRASLAVLNRAGTPEDIANAALFLASDEAGFITGQVLAVDGGRTDKL